MCKFSRNPSNACKRERRSDNCLHIRRQRRVDTAVRVRDGMAEGELRGMERLARDARVWRSVEVVAEQGTAETCEVDADLMGAACVEREADE